jgi:hypothetical protein
MTCGGGDEATSEQHCVKPSISMDSKSSGVCCLIYDMDVETNPSEKNQVQ